MLSDEEMDVYLELRKARFREYHMTNNESDHDVPSGKEEALMDICETQLDRLWRPEFVEMYRNGQLEEIMKEWDLFETAQSDL